MVVAKVNPKDNSYLLRDDFYKHVQRDWPGYSDEEKQLISRLLARKLQPHVSHQSRNLQANVSMPKISEDATPHHSTVKNPAVKRSVPFDSPERLAVKRQRLVDQRLQQQPTANGLLNNKGHEVATPTFNPSFHTKTEFQQTSNHTGNRNGLPGGHSSFPLMHKLSSTSDTPVSESREQEPKKTDKLDNPDITNAVVSEEKPDYVLTYGTIMNLEQRQRYQADFCAEYDEYKNLHSRIATITHMFVQLGSKIKSLSPGTREYKIMEDQILEKYSKYRKKFPGYREEKKRCEYLHEKLSYIKQLIIDYDVSQTSS
ncbi:RNA polymerase II elongation factor ELL2 [Larimichthys crocea]|uniref:RNA polymerase II elongation factor ELL2 n=2 Tax=Larimichthys crocea TaxID=215358 RepID=A0A6G0HE30_LARCR|nr:RNA polymerase II elongation factor ELL2 [Larimichthys crocea]